MNQAVRYVALAFAVLLSAEEASALDTPLSPLYIAGKIGVSAMAASDIANTSRVTSGTAASLTKEDSHDTVLPLGVAIGYNWRKHGISLRTEFEFLNRANFGYDANPVFSNAATLIGLTSKIGSQTLFANAYYDFVNATSFTPFVGGGIGCAINKSTTTLNIVGSPVFDTFKGIHTSFAWNIGAGIAVNLTELMLLELSYRYTDLGSAVWGNASVSGLELTTSSLHANEFLFGVRYQF